MKSIKNKLRRMVNKKIVIEIKKLINAENLNINLNLPDEELIQQFKDKVSWYYMSAHQKLSESFIEKFKDKVNWGWISSSQKLSEQFIEKFQDKVEWGWISSNQKLSEKFIEKFQDKVYGGRISESQKLSEQFIEKFKDEVEWNKISQNPKIKISKRYLCYLYKSGREYEYNLFKNKTGLKRYSKKLERETHVLLFELI